jgi:peptide/nickel transport system permease protein
VTKYIVRRVLIAIPMLLAISIMTYTFINLAPGDPVDAMIDPEFFVGGAGDKLRARMGLDKPIHERYLLWLIEVSPFSSSCADRDPACDTLRLDRVPGTDSWPIPTDIIPTALNLKIWPPDVNLGYSYQFGVSVMSMIRSRIVPTLELTIVSLLAATVIGTALGVVQALRQYSFLDYSFSVGALFGISIPAFFFALLALYIFVAILGWFPSYGMRDYTITKFDIFNLSHLLNHAHHLILPVAVVMIESLAGNMRYMRTAMLDVMRSDYVRTAQAKGLSSWLVFGRHAFRNALLPLVTITTLRLPGLIGGIIIIEFMFAWPGMGQLGIRAISDRDYTIIMGLAMITATLVLFSNLLADVLYAFVDPRVRVEEQG